MTIRMGWNRTLLQQVRVLTVRLWLHYWRSPDFSFSRLLVIAFTSFLLGSIFMNQHYTTVADVQSRVTVIAFTIKLGGTYNLYTIIPFTTAQRAIFYRERSSGMYGTWAFIAATWVEGERITSL